MGRKTNSISLRLKKTNKDYIHCWYGDILYGYNFENSVKMSKIFSNIFQTVDIPCPQFSFTGGYKKISLLLCYLECSAKNKGCESFNIPIKNSLKKQGTTFYPVPLPLKKTNCFSLKQFSKNLNQGGFFETYIFKIGLNQGLYAFQQHGKKQVFSQKWFLVFPLKVYGQTQMEKPKTFKGYHYKGPLGLNLAKENDMANGEKTANIFYSSRTPIGQGFTFHFWPLFYNNKTFFFYKFRGLTKKLKQNHQYKTISTYAQNLQENTDVKKETLSHSIYYILANAGLGFKTKTSKGGTSQYVKPSLLNFQKSVVFFEMGTLGKTKTLVFGKKPGPVYTPVGKHEMLHNCKQHQTVLLQGKKLCTTLLSGPREQLMGGFFKKKKGVEDKVLEQQKDENTYKKGEGGLCYSFNGEAQSQPKQVIKTWDIEKQNYIWSIYNNIKAFWGNLVSISFIKSSNEKASALFLAHYVCYFLERKILFRRIKRQLLLSLPSSKKIKGWGKNQKGANPVFAQNKKDIIGLRISCSGRVGGRSKKAQRSRKETFMWGETGLHVFSNKLDFAQTYAETHFGTVGIQVWVCYK